MKAVVTPAERARVAEAVRAAEQGTSGEIVCVLARSSDDYFFHAAFFLGAATLCFGLAAAVVLDIWGPWVRLFDFALAEFVGLLCGVGLLWAAPGLRIHFVPRALRRRSAHANAMRQFLARNIHVTERRTGVLLFVSLEERHAEVLADSGINARVAPETWGEVIAVLTGHAGQARIADGVCAALARIGALLAAHFPRQKDDRNELDDHLVEL